MLPITQRQYSWVHNVDSCPNTSIGVSPNEMFTHFGQSAPTRNNEDRHYTGCQHNLQLCMVLDGHDGDNAVEYAQMSLAGRLLSDELPSDRTDVILKTIERAFRQTEQYFFRTMDDLIGRRLALKSEISQRSGVVYPNELQRLDSQIKGGTTVVLSLICDNQLYTANIGDSRALLCQEINGQVNVSQLSDDHNVFNPGEQERLHSLGLNIDTLLHHKRLGPFQVTRSIGDYSIKGGYGEIDVLRPAREEPGSCVPFINGPWDIVELNNAFLVLMSDGLYEAYGYCIGTQNPPEIHSSLGSLIARVMKEQRVMERVSQTIVDRVKNQYKEMHERARNDGKLDDMTLIIQNLNYLMDDLISHDQVDSSDRQNVSSGGGVFVAEQTSPVHRNSSPPPSAREHLFEQTPPNSEDITREMGKLDINNKPPPGPRSDKSLSLEDPSKPHRDNRPLVELTEEEKKAGTFIQPYILFPSDFPFDLPLDSL